MLTRKIAFCVVAAMLTAASAGAQNTPPAGTAGEPLRFWEGYPLGTYVIVGGLVFVVGYGGLTLLDGDDDSPTTPTPTPPASPSTSSTS